MSQLRQLAGQTALYGVSSILGRILNYMLVPLHTAIFNKASMGPVTDLYAQVALLLIIFTFGMETTFFRFSTKSKTLRTDYYHYAATAVIVVSLVFTSLIIFNAQGIANALDYPDFKHLVVWLSLIVFTDSVTAIPFAKLRIENKARKFAIAKITTIVLSICLQLFFFYVVKDSELEESLPFSLPGNGIEYIFLANLIANSSLFFLLSKEILVIRFRFNQKVFWTMFIYALPILITGIAGWATEQLDKVLFLDLLPEGFYSHSNSAEALGIYGQTFKLAVIMLLAIQAFRYAGEPFFFSQYQNKNAPELFSKVMTYFVVMASMIYVGVGANIQLLGDIMLTKPEYRVALFLVPIIMLGKLFYGIYINLSIWFKIKDKTIYGTYFTVFGAIITIAGNFILVPLYGYLGSALTIVITYVAMAIACYFVGRKHFPVPYNFAKIGTYILVAFGVVWLSGQISLSNRLWDYGVHILISAVYVILVVLTEKKNLTNTNTPII